MNLIRNLWRELSGWWLHRRAWRGLLRDVDRGKYGDWRRIDVKGEQP